MSQPFKVMVIGAGLSGLALAQGLKKNGIDYVVVDKESEPRDRNWGVTIAWSHPFLAQLLPEHLYQRLSECQPDSSLDAKAAGCEGIMIRKGETGEPIKVVHFPGVRRLNIQKTRTIWSEGIDVKYNKTLVDIELTADGVTACFQDGTSESGSILVGSDGGGSFVRRWLLGEAASARVLPYTFVNFTVTYPAEQALRMDKMIHPIVDVGVHSKAMYIGVFLLDKPDLDKPETWIFYILATWPKGEENGHVPEEQNQIDELHKRMDGWADPYKSAVEWLPKDAQTKAVPMKTWGPDSVWNNHHGRVTLAGDSAHSMTFHRGQGANNAIRDSERFVSTMLQIKAGDRSQNDAVSEYDADVVLRGKQEVEISRLQTEAFHHPETFLNSPVMKMGIKPVVDLNNNNTKAAQPAAS